MLKQRWIGVEMLAGSIYEKVNSYEYSACNFTKELELVRIFQGLC